MKWGGCSHEHPLALSIRDYDWGATDMHPMIDDDGHPFTPITWQGAPWQAWAGPSPSQRRENPFTGHLSRNPYIEGVKMTPR